MNDMHEENRLFMLLWLIGYCVEFPKRLASRIGGHPDWNRHVMYKAIRGGYVQVYKRTVHKRVLCSLRLTDKGAEYVAQRNPEAATMVFSRRDEQISHTSAEKIIRMHSLATAFVMAYTAGAKCLPGEKPPLTRQKQFESPPINPEPGIAYFYSTQEIRRAIEEYEPDTVAKSSRLVGAIVKGDECFCLYDTGRSRMYWLRSTEENTAAGLQTLLNSRGYQISKLTQVIIGHHMSVASKLCRRENRYTSGKYFVLSDFFSASHFLTNDANGDQLLQILLNREQQIEIGKRALNGCEPPSLATRDYDAVDPVEDRPVILNYMCDLLALSNLNPAPYGFTLGPILLCLDYQVSVLQHILGPSVEVRAMKGLTSYGQQEETVGHS